MGERGQAELNITAGGKVANAAGFVGYGTRNDTIRLVTVTGANSLWQNSGALHVGYAGTGELQVADGGRVLASYVALSNPLDSDAWNSKGTLNLNGTSGSRGVLETGYLVEGSGAGGGKINFDGGVLRATAHEANFLRDFETGDVQLLAGGAFIDTNGFNVGISQVLQGSGGLVKQGGGRLTLSGSQAYTGLSTVEAGTLHLAAASSLAGGVLVQAGATFSGAGVIGGAASIFGNHSVGATAAASAGIQTFSQNLAYGSGSSVNWELFGNTASTGDRGVGYDGINVNGTLTFTGPATLQLDFAASGSQVNWSQSLWGSDQKWLLYAVSATITGRNYLTLDSNWKDASGEVINGSSFSLFEDSQGLWLAYSHLVIPEPSRAVLLLTGFLVTLFRRRRQLQPE